MEELGCPASMIPRVCYPSYNTATKIRPHHIVTNPHTPDLTPHLRTLCATLCTLEPQVAAHAAEMFCVLSDPAIYEFENAPPASLGWLTQRSGWKQGALPMAQSNAQLGHPPARRGVGRVCAGERDAKSKRVCCLRAGQQVWRRGIGSNAVAAMMDELAALAAQYGVNTFVTILKAGNFRSLGLLAGLGFVRGSGQQASAHGVEDDELIMLKPA